MPKLRVSVDGTARIYEAGTYAEELRPRRQQRLDGDILIATIDHGMQSGSPSLGIIFLQPTHYIIGETSVKLFQMAAFATMAKYGDLTEGSVMGDFLNAKGGTATLTLSPTVECPHCRKPIPSSCKFCFECGSKQHA